MSHYLTFEEGKVFAHSPGLGAIVELDYPCSTCAVLAKAWEVELPCASCEHHAEHESYYHEVD